MKNNTSGFDRIWTTRTKYLASVLLGSCLILAFAWSELNDPFIMDETEFTSAIRSVVRTGDPSFYSTELSGMKSGLWHPPTYIYYIAAWSITFGYSWFTVRLATLTMTIFTVPAVALLTYSLAIRSPSSELHKFRTVSIAIGLFALSPLVIQNGVLVDINGSILALVSTLYVAWIVWTFSPQSDIGYKKFAGIVALIFLVSWVKFGVLPVLLIATFIYATAVRGAREGLTAVISFFTGFAFFTLTWWVVSNIVGLAFMDPFIHNFGMLYGSTADPSTTYSLSHRILRRCWVLFSELLWLSPFLIILSFISLRTEVATNQSTREITRRLATSPRIFVAMISSALIFQYAALAKMPYGFPKYMGTVTPLLVSLGAFPVSSVFSKLAIKPQKRIVMPIATTIAGVVISVFILPDPFKAPFEQGVAIVAQRATLTVLLGLLITAIVGTFIFIIVNHQSKVAFSYREIGVLCLIILLVGSNIGLVTTQMSADHSTRYFYGQPGMEKSINDVKDAYSDLDRSERSHAALPMDMGYYVDGPHSDVDEVQRLQSKGIKPPLVVVRTQHYYDAPTPIVAELKESKEYRSYRSGWFLIFVHTEQESEEVTSQRLES